MKRLAFLLALLLTGAGLILFLDGASSPRTSSPRSNSHAATPSGETAPSAVMPVNAVIGDLSYRARFGRWPGPEADEDTRIRTHLAFVERLLRSRPTDHLSPRLRTARARNLDRLHDYWTRGIFPRNDGFPHRRQPTFIDDEGRICAVGYLIEQSAGRAVAERINARYKYAYLQTIDAPVLEQWIARSGLTRRELAMIQPMYDGDGCVACVGGEEEVMYRGLEVGVMALNAGTAVLNGVLSARGRRSYVASGAGLAAGAAGLAVGLSDGAHYSTGDVALAGASLLASTINLTAVLSGRASDARQASLIPDTHVALVPTRDQKARMSLSLEWTF